ncbi:MAG: hypothetical protein J5I50_13575 [Chitinophagaceae bacterium]|nr:hypothetical protein [Chitinophagaceae bacterium]
MEKRISFILVTCLICSSCFNQTPAQKAFTTESGVEYFKITPVNANAATQTAAFTGYEVVDPGINNMSVMIVQIPAGWQAQQSVTRIWNGSQPIPQIYLKMSDASNTIEFLPSAPYYYADGPTTRSLRQTAASMGIPQQYQPFELPPMRPVQYIKQVLMPYLQQNGLRFQLNGERDLGTQKQWLDLSPSEHGYVEGQMADGRKIRVECAISVNTTQMNGEVYYNWTASPSIMTTTSGDLEKLYSTIKHVRQTRKVNPEWVAQTSDMSRRGNISNREIAQRDYENVMAYRNAVSNMHKQVMEERGLSTTRNNEAFRDALGGTARFENPRSGKRINLDDSYKYYYTDNLGNYYASNRPIDFKARGWTEVKRLENTEY